MMRRPDRYRIATALVTAGLLGGAAPHGLSLFADLPDHLAQALSSRALAAAAAIGLTDTEVLGEPYALSRDGTPLAVLMTGRGADNRPDRHTCFVVAIAAGTEATTLVPTIGRGRFAARNCQGHDALGLLPSATGTVRLGIVYETDVEPLTVPLVLSWHLGTPPAIDDTGTAACLARHATTIAEMRRPGCGTPSKLERAFPSL